MKLKYFIDAWLILLLAVGFGAALAGVQMALADRITENKRMKTLSRIPVIVPEAIDTQTVEIEIDGQTVYKAMGPGGHLGWVIKGKGAGYAGDIEVLIGLSPDATKLTGMDVLSQTETANLGDKITLPEFRDQFAGLDAAQPTKLDKQGGNIANITGATISADSVCSIVNKTVAKWKDKLAAKR